MRIQHRFQNYTFAANFKTYSELGVLSPNDIMPEGVEYILHISIIHYDTKQGKVFSLLIYLTIIFNGKIYPH